MQDARLEMDFGRESRMVSTRALEFFPYSTYVYVMCEVVMLGPGACDLRFVLAAPYLHAHLVYLGVSVFFSLDACVLIE